MTPSTAQVLPFEAVNDSIKIVGEIEQTMKLPAIPELPDYSTADLSKLDKMADLLDLKVRSRKILEATKLMHECAREYRELLMQRHRLPDVNITFENTVIELSWYERLSQDVRLNRTIAVRGPAGNGKSTGVQAVLKALDYNIHHMDCTDSVTVDQLVGGLVPKASNGGIDLVLQDGLFMKAFKDPKAAIQLDEFDALDPRVAMALQSALHNTRGKKRWLAIPDHPQGGIEAVSDMPVIVTMNTWGTGATREYVGRNTIDSATMDRFNSIIDTTYEKEKEILMQTNLQPSEINELISAAQNIRAKIEKEGFKIIFSTRRLLDIAETMVALNKSIGSALNECFYGRIAPEYVTKLRA